MQELNQGAGSFDTRAVDVVVAPSSVHLSQVMDSIDPRYGVAAQNVWLKGPGAFTGETPAEMLKDLGVNWVITGGWGVTCCGQRVSLDFMKLVCSQMHRNSCISVRPSQLRSADRARQHCRVGERPHCLLLAP
jgi:hypothetical protein